MVGCIKDAPAPPGEAFGEYREKRQMHPLWTPSDSMQRADPQPGLVNMPCLPPSPTCFVRVTGGRGGGEELDIHSEVYVSPTIQSDEYDAYWAAN